MFGHRFEFRRRHGRPRRIITHDSRTDTTTAPLITLRRGSVGVSVGNVIGSNIYKITGILGVAAVLRPFVVSGAALQTLAWLAVVSVFVVAALWTDRVLARLEGAVLIASEIVRWFLGLFG